MMCFDNAFTVFAGPNGGGKSSLVYSLWKDNPSAPYVCADSIAKEAPICGIQKMCIRDSPMSLAKLIEANERVSVLSRENVKDYRTSRGKRLTV